MKRPRLTAEVLAGLRHMAEVARMARTAGHRPDVEAALKWIDRAAEADESKGRAER